MSKFSLDPTSGRNPEPRRLEQEVPSKKKPENQPAQKVSFREVLKSVVDPAEGAPAIRQELVNQYKASLAQGTYEVKARELAEKMIQKIRENKAREII